jgi:hypothetical protein
MTRRSLLALATNTILAGLITIVVGLDLTAVWR